MPSQAEIRKAVKEHAAASAAYQANKQKRTPMDHVAVERGKRRPGPAERAAAARRAEEAAADSRARARTACRRKIEGCTSFVQLLRIFGVPTDPARLKDAYRIAVRMYHPDSNSRDRAWRTEEEKYEAEEVMKIINERKPADL
ncbi:hypothetical protein COHA_010308 [Chlorella ohadii]|uniref:J domain-containing protein n=1 Tax=Chlorella ohadii TaxID=2649997 RepID=A0AAD5GZS7_9CHLO|nr:hypothetical protein COHA_010308 [Chlorella ohadii]